MAIKVMYTHITNYLEKQNKNKKCNNANIYIHSDIHLDYPNHISGLRHEIQFWIFSFAVMMYVLDFASISDSLFFRELLILYFDTFIYE